MFVKRKKEEKFLANIYAALGNGNNTGPDWW